jgi:hypothetical protein
MTSFADLVKHGVLMIIPIYAKVSFNKSCPLSPLSVEAGVNWDFIVFVIII